MQYTYFKGGKQSDTISAGQRLEGVTYYPLPDKFNPKNDTAILDNGEIKILWGDKQKQRDQTIQDEGIQQIITALKTQIKDEIEDKGKVGSITSQLTALAAACLNLTRRVEQVEDLLGFPAHEMTPQQQQNYDKAESLLSIKQHYRPKLTKLKACKTVEQAELIVKG